MSKFSFVDGERIRKAHSVRTIPPIFERLAVSLAGIPGCVRQVVQIGAHGRGQYSGSLTQGLLLLLLEQVHVQIPMVFEPSLMGLHAQGEHQA